MWLPGNLHVSSHFTVMEHARFIEGWELDPFFSGKTHVSFEHQYIIKVSLQSSVTLHYPITIQYPHGKGKWCLSFMHICPLKATAIVFDIEEIFTCMIGEKGNEYIKIVLLITVSYNWYHAKNFLRFHFIF